MPQVLYSDVDISVDERRKELLINPKGERFYFIDLEDRSMVFENATVIVDEEGKIEIEGEQTLYTEHSDMGRNYELMVSMHPKELIHRRTFLGMVWYSVNGTMTRRVKTRYCCRYKEYDCIERLEFLSNSFTEQ